MTRLILTYDDDSRTVLVVSSDGDVHGQIEDASGLAQFNLGDTDLSEQPKMDGVILWTAPNVGHPQPDAFDTIEWRWIGPVDDVWDYWTENYDSDPFKAYENGDVALFDPRFRNTSEVEQ